MYYDGGQLQCWYTSGLLENYYANITDWVLDLTPVPGWHTLQIVTDVYDDVAESNESDNQWQTSFYWDVYNTQPNLTPYTPSGWDYPIVPSSVQGTNVVNTLYSNQNTYIDWAIANLGAADATATFYTCLYYDGSQLQCWYTNGLQTYYYSYVLDWVLSLTPVQGMHTLKIVTDVYNDVAESNESDNEWQWDFYWDTSVDCDAVLAAFDDWLGGTAVPSIPSEPSA
jgi:subtilase family serine protease